MSCTKCDRRDRLRLATLVTQHGLNYPITRLRLDLVDECERGHPKTWAWEPCGVHFPNLPVIMEAWRD